MPEPQSPTPRSEPGRDLIAPRLGLSYIRRVLGVQQLGLVLVILLLTAVLAAFAGSHFDRRAGEVVNNFWNSYTLLQTVTDASFFAIMAIGALVASEFFARRALRRVHGL